MTSPSRLAVVAGLLVLFAVARMAHRRWRHGLHDQPGTEHPRLPDALVEGSARTWVVFTTPLCASCDTVIGDIAAHEPHARVVKVDATVDRALAGAYGVRSAPTVVLAGEGGEVTTRLVGAAAVADYVRRPA